VMMRMGSHMALTFHPELTNDNRIHVCWLKAFHPAFKQELL
jgi:glutamine amidotransferase PdxT